VTLPTILEAMDDAELFGRAFSEPSWRPWRAFLGALFGLGLSNDLAALARECTGRPDLPGAGFREGWLACGRRAGKSRVLALIAVYVAAFVGWRERLAPGETGVVMILATDRAQASVLLAYVRGLLAEIPLLRPLVTGETAESVELGAQRVAIEVHTSSFRAVRGRTVIAALLDEVAFWRSETSANPAAEVVRALRPALATLAPQSLLIDASSPYARSGVLWDQFNRHHGRKGSPVLVWKAPSLIMNPSLSPGLIAAELEADPEAGAAEWLAEFRRDVDRFIGQEAVEDAVVAGRRELPPVAGVVYRSFTDPSGGSQDSMTLAIAHGGEDGRVVLDCVRERRPPFSPESVVDEFSAVLKSYGLSYVTGDRYGGEWPREVFRKAGIGYQTSERAKSEIYLEVLPLLNAGRVELLDNQRLIAQLSGLERRTSRSGKDSVDHGPGGHDDLINSAAGALVLAKVQPVIDAPLAAGPSLESYTMYFGGEVALPWELGAESPF
jgi:hypothetical protein